MPARLIPSRAEAAPLEPCPTTSGRDTSPALCSDALSYAEPAATSAESAPGVRAGRLAARIRRFPAAQDAVAAIEFALILPVLLAILFGGIQLVAYVNATRKVELVASSVSQMISQASPPSNATTASVNAADLHFSFDAALVLFPYLMTDAQRQGIAWWRNITINYASIQFTKLSSACTNTVDLSACYRANVVWTSTGTSQPASGAAYRPCLVPQTPADNDAPPSRTSLPRSVYGPASLIVIDVVFTFAPTFGARFVPPVRIARSAYVQPRYATLVTYDTTNDDGIATQCPGY